MIISLTCLVLEIAELKMVECSIRSIPLIKFYILSFQHHSTINQNEASDANNRYVFIYGKVYIQLTSDDMNSSANREADELTDAETDTYIQFTYNFIYFQTN